MYWIIIWNDIRNIVGVFFIMKNKIKQGKANERAKKWYRNNKERALKQRKRRYDENRQKELKERKDYYEKNKQRIIKSRKTRFDNDKEYEKKCRIRQKHGNIIRYNFPEINCFLCPSNKDVQIHHPDWNESDMFALLCKSCHLKLHEELRNGY